MKKILLFLLINFYSFYWAQELYRISLENFSYTMTQRTQRGSVNSKVIINIALEDGTFEQLYYKPLPNRGTHNELSYNNTIIVNKKPLYIHYDIFINWRNGANTRTNNARYHSINSCYSNILFENISSKLTNFKYNIKISPIHTIKLEENNIYNTFLPTYDKVTLLGKKGLEDHLYQYQYSFTPDDNNSWIDIPSHLYHLDKLSVSAQDLFLNNSHNYIGQKVYFRIVSCYDNGDYRSKSNIIPLTITKSAPKIFSHQETAPLCFDGKGAVSFTFDRTLLPDETADFVLNGEYIRDTNPSLNQHLVEQLRNGTTVTLPDAEHGTHTLSIVGTYKGHPTYSGAEQSRQFTITPPTPVEFSVTSSQNVFCHGGNDGHIQLSASGGLGDYQYSLDNGVSWVNFNQVNTTQISNLEKGNYTIKVRDKNLCIAKENGNEKQVSVNITQPDAPISFNDIEVVEPKGYGLSNGYIVLTVKGGTPETDGTYHYEWRKDSPTGAILTNVETSPNTSNGVSFKLNNITAGKYYLTVKDAHYANASSNLEACGILTQEFVVSQPDPLVSNIEVSKKISCHIDNQYEFKLDLNANGIPDESEDGALKSVTTGGVPPYTYQWQKETNGSFQDISGATTSELAEQTIGKYKLLIEDANGNTTHAEYTFIYPEQLKIALQGRDLLCHNGNDGMAEVVATGGTGNYSYRWNNLEKTSKIENIAAGNYFVLVTDEHLCKVKENIDIHQPDEIIINDILVQDPLSPNANNGQIHIGLNGGHAPYTVSWSNGMTGEHISGLAEGTYIAQIQDANACLITKPYTLTDPERLPLELGEDIVTLCLGDTKTYNVKINDPLATYTWTDANGNIISNQPEITLSQAGVYTITIVNSNGNTASDSVEIKLSSEVLQPEFMITTHAYVEAPIKLVNTSAIPPQSVEWIIPQNQGIQVVSQSDEYLEVIFPSVGGYTFGLKGKQGACEKTFYKNIIVEENIRGVNLAPTSISNIKEFTIAPNPNQGQFKVFIKLNQPASVKLRLMDIITHEVMPPIIKAKGTEFEIPIDINVAAANYFIILETGNEAQAQKVSIIR